MINVLMAPDDVSETQLNMRIVQANAIAFLTHTNTCES